MMNPQLLSKYLAWQSDIGCDEVILPHPLVRKEKTPSPGKSESTPQKAFQHADAFRPTSASNIFGDMARAFQTTETTNKANLPHSTNSPNRLEVTARDNPKPVSRVETIQYPKFDNLDSLREYLSNQAKSIFSSETDISLLQGHGPVTAPLALLALQPSEADCQAGQLFSGEAGLLLEKMMRAIRLDCSMLYRSSVIKHFSPGRVWNRRELTRILPLLYAEMGLIQAPVVLLLGENCAQAVLKTTKTMEELRQIPHREGNRDFVVTYHPDDLLRREEWKRKAWEDLQWLQRRLQQIQAQA